MKAIKNSLNIDDTYTKMYRRPKSKEQTRVKDNVFLVRGYNQMADILHLPIDTFGYSKLLIVVDIADDSFDIEKMKDSESASETLKAYKRMFKRGIIDIPKASLTTDGAGGFKGEFNDFLFDNGVDHRTTRVGRHRQLANVDNLCKQLGELFHGIMNKKEEETGKRSVKWTYMIDTIRIKLNRFRTKSLPTDITTYDYPFFDPTEEQKTEGKKGEKVKFAMIKPKYKVKDMVNVLLQEPVDALGKKHTDNRFRMGDYRLSKKKYKITAIFYYAGDVPYRYQIEGLPGASYTEQELKQV